MTSPHLDYRPFLFAGFTLGLLTLCSWPRQWLVSGAPLLQFLVLLGEAKGHRVLPKLHLWPLFTTLNLLYSISSTSWLLYWVFTALYYPATFLVCLFQFGIVGRFVRNNLRAMLRELQFIDDKIAFFNIPALEIDTEVDGLMVLRGITFSLSSLSFVVHGVEVGIKLSDDMELAIQTEEVTVKLFRNIEISNCFANLKGGEHEMTFGKVAIGSYDADGDAVFIEGTPLLKAASKEADTRRPSTSDSGVSTNEATPQSSLAPSVTSNEGRQRPQTVKMTDEMTDGSPPHDSSTKDGFSSIDQMHPDNEEATGRYQQTIDFIVETSTVDEARKYVKQAIHEAAKTDDNTFDCDDLNGMRAAICSRMHTTPSVPHPPQKSIKVTTLQNLMPPYIRRFMHRLPMLLRLLLNPLSYFHPVYISSITATASGRWIEYILIEKIFQEYAESNSEVRVLKKRIAQWLADANFAVELVGIAGVAQVPFLSTYDIICELGFQDVMAYRTLPDKVELKQVVRLGGADARFHVPSFLLPHHDHLLPPLPSTEQKRELESDIDAADGRPKEIQAEHQLEQAEKDEANVKISVHARLPACFDQELLDFVAALVKATKVVELEKQPSVMDEEVHGLKDFSRVLKGGMKDGFKRAVVDGVVSDRWISKMVGKITKKLEAARGEAGYSGDIPVALAVYRTGEVDRDGEKLLP